jgi:thiosulfate/3-mercaptopyruvate sulfurtransferase
MSQKDTDSLRSPILISAPDLKAAVEKDNLLLLDIRFRPDNPDGRPAYRDGHIPGAVYVDLPTELAGEPKGFSGRRPLPDIRDLQRSARR